MFAERTAHLMRLPGSHIDLRPCPGIDAPALVPAVRNPVAGTAPTASRRAASPFRRKRKGIPMLYYCNAVSEERRQQMTPLAELLPDVVDPYSEALAYEYLYSLPSSSLKTISERTVLRNMLPSEAMGESIVVEDEYDEVERFFSSKLGGFGVAVENTPQYPRKLHAAAERVPLVYYRGDINLAERKSVSVVGARKASPEGLARAARLGRILAKSGIVVVSGLAAGIDTSALSSCIQHGGRVIGVIGTPIDEVYPKQNSSLQETIARRHLLVSQVPFYRYSRQPFQSKKCYFRERNVTMAAVSDATVIVEASDTSGSLIQARACIKQGRPLFIMKSCLENESISWPARFVGSGAKVLERPDELLGELGIRNG